MARDDRPVEQWELNDYLEYFASSGRLFGVADAFKDINTKMREKQAMEQKVVEHDRMYDWEKKLDAIKAEAESYLADHKDPKTSDGKRRVDVMNALVGYCSREKRLTEPEANAKFFFGKSFEELRKGATFEDIKNQVLELDAVEEMPFTSENAISYVNKVSQLVQAAESYIHANRMKDRGLWEGKEPEDILRNANASNLKIVHYDYAMAIVHKYKPCLDSARDLTQVKEVMKKDNPEWKDLLALRTKEYTISGSETIKGDKASQRILTTVDGERGFVTRPNKVVTMSEKLEQYYAENQNENSKVIFDNETLIKKHYPETKDANFSQKSIDSIFFVNSMKKWDQIQNEEKKEEIRKIFLSDRTALTNVYKEFANKLYNEPWVKNDAKGKIEAYSTLVNSSNISQESKDKMLQNADILMDMMSSISHKQVVVGNESALMGMDNILYENILNMDPAEKDYKQNLTKLRSLLNNETAKKDVIRMHAEASGAHTVSELGNMNEKDNLELSSRNVATSRMASLLGIDYLVAHSEKVIINENGKKTVGCFMKFADGMDVRNEWQYDSLKKLAAVNYQDISQGLAKDGCTMNLFDVICNQKDRHGGNFFQIISEPNEKGEREVTGLRAIDNDLAFGRSSIKQGQSALLEEITFVDKDLAERLSTVTRDQLEYALGDLISSIEIDAVMTRITKINKRIADKEMIVISGDEWKLDRYKGKSPDELDTEGKKYVDAVESYKKAVTSRFDSKISDISKAGYEIHQKRKDLEKIEKTHEEYRQNIKSIEEAIKDSKSQKLDLGIHEKTADSTRAKRAAIFDKLVAGRDDAHKTPAAETKTQETKVLMYAKDLSEPQRASDRGIKFGAAREKAAKMKELESSFTEITKDDIAKANKDVKKPIIGGHRGPKK